MSARRRNLALAAIAILLAAGAAALAAGDDDRSTSSTSSSAARPVVNVEAQSAADFSDPRRVVGWADDVFFGQVVRQGPTTRPAPGRVVQTSFDVRVLDSIKGTAEGVTTIVQRGGVDERGRLMTYEHDALMKPGQIYLLASLTSLTDPDYRLAIARYGTVHVPDAAAYRVLKIKFEEAAAEPIGPRAKRR